MQFGRSTRSELPMQRVVSAWKGRASCRVKLLDGVPKMHALYSYGKTIPIPHNFIHSHNNDISTLTHSVKERILSCKNLIGEQDAPPRVNTVVVKQMLAPFRRGMYKFLPRGLSPVSRQKFVEFYKGRKRTIYETARTNLDLFGLQTYHSYISNFVKFEKIVKELAVPRNISPRRPEYNIEVGRYLKPIEHTVYKCIQLVFGSDTPIVSKGLNANEVGEAIAQKWDCFDNPVAIGADASRFDQHVSRAALEFEHGVYKTMYGGDKKLKRLLKRQLFNRMVGRCPDGVIKTTVEGVRMSGDMNTAMGNCIIMCAIVYSFFSRHGIHGELINNGDDCVLFVEKADEHMVLERFPQFCWDLGFLMEMEEPVHTLEEIEFCQTHPICTGDQWVLVRNFPSSIAKDSVSTKPLRTPTEFNTMRLSIAQCGMALAGNVPVYGAFYRMLARGAGCRVDGDDTMSGMKYLARGMTTGNVVSDIARESFFHAFGYSPDEQIALEREYEKIDLCFSCPLPVEEFPGSELFQDK